MLLLLLVPIKNLSEGSTIKKNSSSLPLNKMRQLLL